MKREKSLSLLDVILDFKDLPQATKVWLLEKSELQCYPAGNFIFKKGDKVNQMRMIVEGKFQIRIEQKGGWRDVGTFEKGTVTGLLPYSRMQSASGSAVAIEDAAVLSLHKKHFPELIQKHQELTTVLVHSMTSRVREFTQSQQQNEKLMALGKLSAGLAHELNNPASAIVRSSHLLKRHLGTVPDKFKAVMNIAASDRQVDLVNDVLFEKINTPHKRLNLLEQTELEDEIIEYLMEKDIHDADDYSNLFVDYSFQKEDFELLFEKLNDKDFPAVIGWLAQVLATEKMVDEIEKSSSRIADLVKSIKSYTHMDRSQNRELVDPSIGIEDTLAILNHKIKRKNVELKLEVENGLPNINLLPSEINQVWMNLIDNAIDALPEKGGLLEIDIKKENNFLIVSVKDNGSGISKEDASHIFDPFFTTKKVGEGTGLGLDVAKRIVDHHNGKLTLKSTPGTTTFEVCIPYE
ncbi:MAG: ATP-binding protein [Vicingaceae bacterium]